MTEGVVSKLHSAFAIGANVAEACRFAGISRDSFYEKIKKDAEFSDTIEQIKLQLPLKARNAMAKKIHNEDTRVVLWYLERKYKKEFSSRIEMEHDASNEVLALVADIKY